jgi:hypothetical protein
MDGIDERRSASQETHRNRRALEGDWSSGLPGPLHAHGLAAPEPIGLPPEPEPAASEPATLVAREPAEPAVEAPADWGVASEPPAPEAAAEQPRDVSAEPPPDVSAEPPPDVSAEQPPEPLPEEEFPVTLSEADEIHEETTAPIDVAPFSETPVAVEPLQEGGEAEAIEAPFSETPVAVEPLQEGGEAEAIEAPFAETPVAVEPLHEGGEAEAIDAEAALAQMEASPPEMEPAPAEMEAVPLDIEPIPAERDVAAEAPEPHVAAEAAEPDAGLAPTETDAAAETAEPASADWLAHPDAMAPETWEATTIDADAAAQSPPELAEAAPDGTDFFETETTAPPPSPETAGADAWGEPTVAPTSPSPDVEPWAIPVETPSQGSPVAPEIASPAETGELTEEPPAPGWATDRREIATPADAGELTEEPPEPDWARERRDVAAPTASELTEEPPEPDWAKGPREVFNPLPKGATLADEEAPPGIEGDRAAPPQLELVRGPETLEDAEDLLVPVNPTPPAGVPPMESAQPLVVPGEQRVAIHTRAGQTRRGTVIDLDLSQPRIPLEPQGGGSTENIDHSDVKAIFFMLAPGEKGEAAEGRAVRVTFSDGRSIEGHRQGDESSQGFFLVPLDAQRTNTRRIYVARDAVSEMVDL